MKHASDPYKYFRVEARELLEGLTRGLLDLERSNGDDAEILGQCFRLAHTLKGAARVVKQLRIGEISHAIEDALADLRDSGEPVTVEHVTEMLRLLDIIRGELTGIDAPPESSAGTDAPPDTPRTRIPRRPDGSSGAEPFETLRIEITDMDAILDGITEAKVQLLPLRSGAEALSQALRSASSTLEQIVAHRESGRTSIMSSERWIARMEASLEGIRTALLNARRDIDAGLGRIEGEFHELSALASTLRLVPASAAFDSLELGARDAADLLDKQIEFSATGGETRLEGHILSALRDALLHIVRNAVDHGIESSSDRVLLGKPPAGHIRLRVERRGSRVAFQCTDDGRGINVASLRRAAVLQGLISPADAEALNAADAMELMFLPGVSTSPTVTEVSGRGVGLDVVREVTSRFKGEIRASSEPGAGTKIELLVPMSLSSLTALTLSSEGMLALLPLDAVSGTMRLLDGDVVRSSDGESILYEGQAIPFATLSSLLLSRPAASAPEVWSAVVVEWGGRRKALGVERLLGTRDVIIKPLPSAAGPQPMVIGASFDAQGDPILVLDPQGLIGAPRHIFSRPAAEPSFASIAPVLIIDDSLTTRMLEQSILESAGYHVHLASSGEEGLTKAREREYGLFIVDVEMPGMNGFEFVRQAKADPSLAHIPVIMVTSLSSPADRRRGAEVGVSAYVVKGEFDQKFFVQKVAQLMGSERG